MDSYWTARVGTATCPMLTAGETTFAVIVETEDDLEPQPSADGVSRLQGIELMPDTITLGASISWRHTEHVIGNSWAPRGAAERARRGDWRY